MSPFKSSNTLQNSVNSYSFPKEDRFHLNYKKNSPDSLYSIPESKSQRFTSQGYGNKVEMHNLTGKGAPAPNAYKLKSCFDNYLDHKKGVIFLEKFTPMVYLYLKSYIFNILANHK